MDREAWRSAIYGFAKSRTRLSDWTECGLIFCISWTNFTSLRAQLFSSTLRVNPIIRLLIIRLKRNVRVQRFVFQNENKNILFYSSFLSDFFFLSYKKQYCGCTYCSLPYPKVTILWLGIIVWFLFGHDCWQLSDFPGDSLIKLFACQCRICRRCGFEPGLGRSPGGGNGNPLSILT